MCYTFCVHSHTRTLKPFLSSYASKTAEPEDGVVHVRKIMGVGQSLLSPAINFDSVCLNLCHFDGNENSS